jgi:Tfp pilus assembly major pilin PilA
MSIEGSLTRKLDIRFIDARFMVNEAKVNMGITGYLTEEQALKVQNEAIKIFKGQSDEVKRTMRRLKDDLEEVKSSGSLNFKHMDSSENSGTRSNSTASDEFSTRASTRMTKKGSWFSGKV